MNAMRWWLPIYAGLLACAPEQKAMTMFSDKFERRQGALCRGFRDQKEMALVFTGGEYGEGLEHILDELKKRKIKGGFFFTGDFFEVKAHQPLIKRLVREGHYLGPHSDKHLLLADWEHEKTLVARDEFEADLKKNIDRCVSYGFPRKEIRYWIPPYEHTSLEVCGWSSEMGMTMINFTHGTLSFTDYAPEDDRAFRPSTVILQSIKDYPAKDPDGFNGYVLLLHAGSGTRQDKMHKHFSEVLDFLAGQGYSFLRVDKLYDKGILK